MPRLLFSCAYDGIAYRGWQSQTCGKAAQDRVEAAFAQILGTTQRIHASGRTDAGVHARAQRFHIDIPEDNRMPHRAWIPALNSKLPASLRITGVMEVAAGFHARYDAQSKSYDYVIETAEVCSPFDSGRVWHQPRSFDVDLLAQALQCYVGKHDFRMFAAKRGNEPSPAPEDFYMREIWEASLRREGSLLHLRFRGNGFMYRMVRLLVGTAHQVAVGRMSCQQLGEMLSEYSETEKSQYCAPAQGLYLHEVEY